MTEKKEITLPIKCSTVKKTIQSVKKIGVIVAHILTISSWTVLLYLAIFYNKQHNPFESHPLYNLMSVIMVISVMLGPVFLMKYYDNRPIPINFPKLPTIKCIKDD
jgi:hypothetical protein